MYHILLTFLIKVELVQNIKDVSTTNEQNYYKILYEKNFIESIIIEQRNRYFLDFDISEAIIDLNITLNSYKDSLKSLKIDYDNLHSIQEEIYDKEFRFTTKKVNNLLISLEKCYETICNNIDELSNSDSFIYIYNLIENDLINVLSGLKLLLIENEELDRICHDLDQWMPYNKKILLFLNSVKHLLNIKFSVNTYLKPQKYNYIVDLLKTNHKCSGKSSQGLNIELQKKLMDLNFNINKYLNYIDLFIVPFN